jgi:hypothetical protein
MEYQDDDREYIRPARTPTLSPKEAYDALRAQYQTTTDDVMTRWKAGQISAGEAWGLLPCHPHPAGATTAYISEVRYAFAGKHDLWPLYQAVVQESGRSTMGDYNIIDPDWNRRVLGQYSERKNAEVQALQTLDNAVRAEDARQRAKDVARTQRRWTAEDEDEERQVRILARAIRLARDM